jgi:leucyl aminopeptidase
MKTLRTLSLSASGAPAGGALFAVKDGVPDPSAPAEVKAFAEAAHFEGAAGSVSWVAGAARPALLVGLGDGSPAAVRSGFAAAGKCLVSTRWLPEGIVFAAPGGTDAAFAGEALLSGAYAFDARGTPAREGSATVAFPAGAADAVARAVKAAEILSAMRDEANRSASDRTAGEVAKDWAALAERFGLAAKVYGPEELEKEGCGAHAAVARGAGEGAWLLRAEWPGNGGEAKALVGKAVLFDAGGICLKPSKGMEWMQYDLCGGAAVLAAAMLCAAEKTAQRVVAWVPMAKNLPDGRATVPGDIVRAKNGKTVEIINTDAEGRLLLADALCMAAAEKPACIVDAATLTGAVVIALGHFAAGVMGTDETVVDALRAAGEATGERVWPLPLWKEYGKSLEGRFADLKNMGDGTAGTITAGAFLKEFVPTDIPWGHVDIAGTAWREKAEADGAVGATLFGARLLAAFAARGGGVAAASDE